MGRSRRWLGVLVAWTAAVLVVASGVGWSMADHDRELATIERRLFDLPLPDGAVLTERRARIGDGHSELSDLGFDPHRDHCEYRVWIELETDLGVDGVARFYEAVEVDGLSIGLRGPGRIRVEDIEQGAPGWDPRCNRGLGL